MYRRSYSVEKSQLAPKVSSMVKTSPGFQPEQRQRSSTNPSCQTRIGSKTVNLKDSLSMQAPNNYTQVITTALNSNPPISIKNSNQFLRPKKSPHVSSLPQLHQMASPRTTRGKSSPSITEGKSSSTSKQATLRDCTSASSVQSVCLSCATW